MATMKSHTDIPQSKQLMEILPHESADMWFVDGLVMMQVALKEKDFISKFENVFPCWSLAALLSLIPQEIFDGEYIVNITEGCDNRWVLTYDHYENRNHSYYGLSVGADNPIDACVEMIIRLHERKLL